MSFESVDILQKTLAQNVFSHTKDPKKAAGRALGTLVEIITYYLLKSWGLNNQISIERGLEEYGNPDITHNVEYSLHPVLGISELKIDRDHRSITSARLIKALTQNHFDLTSYTIKQNQLIANGVIRNACTFATSDKKHLLCSVLKQSDQEMFLQIYEQHRKPYAIFECKRVGVEEGMTKGPQTIEKAKQGAYVARTASSLQKIRSEDGRMFGIIYLSDGTFVIKPFVELMEEIIFSNDKELLRRFILTVGIVSNHGNWFTSDNPNKELRVLSSSYDWLIFLTDKGLSEFIDKLLFNPTSHFHPVKQAFLSSYTKDKKTNQFTKVRMNIEADIILRNFFSEELETIEKWFNVISPKGKTLNTLKSELKALEVKNWKDILS